jgi:transposase-like protein
VRRTLLPSVEIEEEIDALLAGERVEVHPLELVSELGKLGVRLVLQRAVEEEVDAWLGRARYERRAGAAPGKRNGYRPRRLQTGEGEIVVELPQVREACAPFTSKLFRRRKRFLASEPLKALVIGAFVRGLSMRDVESLCEEAGLGQVFEVDRLSALPRAEGALPGVPRARPLRAAAGLLVPRCDLPAGPALRRQGGRALRLGDQ